MARPRNQSKQKLPRGIITWVHQPVSAIGRRNTVVENMARRVSRGSVQATAKLLRESQRRTDVRTTAKPAKPTAKPSKKR